MRNQKLGFHCLTNLAIDFDEIQYIAQPIGLLNLMLNSFCISDIQGRELC